MEDDEGIATTVVIKARSAYTWLDKLRFRKGLHTQEGNLDLSLVNEFGSRDSNEVFQCSDLDVRTLEESCKVLFNAREKLGRKSRKLCFLSKASEHVVKEFKHYTGQSDGGKASRLGNETVQLWEDENGRFAHCGSENAAAVGSMNGATEEDRFWASGASERSDEAPTSNLSPKPTVPQKVGGEYSSVKQNSGTTLVSPLGTEAVACQDASKSVAKRNRRSVADLGLSIAAKTQKLHKFEETRVVAQEHRQQRSGSKRRQSPEENGFTSGKNQGQPTLVIEPAADQSKKQATQVLELASDHPSKKPPDSLINITYQVFLQAGRGGLTAREAASRIEDAGRGAVFQGLVKPRIKIGKIIRNNPYYFQAGEGRYILCEAIVGVTQAVAPPLPQFLPDTTVQEKPAPVKTDIPAPVKTDSRKEAAAMARREGTARYWAQMNASGRTRVPKSRHVKPGATRHKLPPVYWKSDESCVTLKEGEGAKWEEKPGKDESEAVVQAHAKPRLKGMYKNAIGGKPCKRSDGKNWQCPLTAPPNSNYCEHHQKRMMKDTGES